MVARHAETVALLLGSDSPGAVEPRAPRPGTVVERFAPEFAGRARDAEFLTSPDLRKNWVVGFRDGGELLVLKVYRDTLSFRLHTLTSTILARVAKAYVLRATGPARAENEARCVTSFRAAGIAAPEIRARPGAIATVFARVEGLNAAKQLAADPDESFAVQIAAGMGSDMARRHEAALANGDRFLFHPHPRLTHVMVTAGGPRTYIDFEGVVNPTLGLAELAALETGTFLSYLARSRPTRGDAVLRAAAGGLGDAALARWRAYAPGLLWRLSSSARRRHARLSRFARSLDPV